MERVRKGNSEYVKLEQRLALLAWLNSLFGYERNRDLLADMRETAEGFDGRGRSGGRISRWRTWRSSSTSSCATRCCRS